MSDLPIFSSSQVNDQPKVEYAFSLRLNLIEKFSNNDTI